MENSPTGTKILLEKRIKGERSAVLIVNTNSRKGKKFFSAAVNELTKKGITIADLYPVQYPERLPGIVQEAVKHHKLIVVGGGDGTISSVVNYFAYRDVVLGILPLGTVNSFARTLGIPLDLKGAVEVIANGKLIDVDLGKMGHNYFSNIVAIGFAAKIARNISHRLKKYTGILAYGLTGARTLFSHRPFECALIMNENTIKVNTHQVVITNGGYFGITSIAPGASAVDRNLDVFVMDTPSRRQTIKLWVAFLLHKTAIFPNALLFKTKDVIIEAIPPQYVEVDGEITEQTPVHITLAPNALKVMAPKELMLSEEPSP